MSKHSCPADMIFSKKHGKCIQPDLEVVQGAEDPNSRSRASPNLTFPTHKKRKEVRQW